ncbi:MAG TPA: AAA family ATPase [Streptosporangiaceae bacterium]|nr:AAA family ATPase [Streptosporangiaceae bacterium]
MIIQMAGLPGTGKSTLARALSAELAGVVLDKDFIRQALFTDAVTYTREQDDFCVAVMFTTAAWLLGHGHHTVILDGRTCSRSYQVDQVRAFARSHGQHLALIECVCRESTARQRLAADTSHPAANRDFALYRRLRDSAELIPPPKLAIDTDNEPADVLARCLSLLHDRHTIAYPAGTPA